MDKSRKKKKRLRAECDKLYAEVVMKIHNGRSVVSGKQAYQVHHFFPKGLFGFLRYNLDNGCPVTIGEHFEHHHKGNPTIHKRIMDNRSSKWYNELLEKSKETPASYQTLKYYQDTITRLTELLEE